MTGAGQVAAEEGEDFALAGGEGVEGRSHGTRIVAPWEGRRTTRKVGEIVHRRHRRTLNLFVAGRA